MSVLEDLLAIFDWRSLAVLRRNLFVYLRNWKTAFIPPVLEPVVYFLAFGLGLRGYVGDMNYRGGTIDYAAYVAPGLLAYTAFATPFFEALYSSYVRMFYQKTWDGILATQVELRHIVWGEVLWAGLRGFANTSLVAMVLAVFHACGYLTLHLPWLLVVPFLAMAAGWAFGAFGLIFTAVVPSIDHMNYPSFLIGVPLGFISNTYFPVETDSAAVQAVVALNPVAQLAETARGLLVVGAPGPHLARLVVLVLACIVVFTLLAQRLTKRRITGE